MFQLNIYNISYLSFRLLPIILPTYFILSSLFSQDVKGLIYLVGLLMACFISIMFGNTLSDWIAIQDETPFPGRDKCNLITLNGTSPISNVPLSQAVYSYTFWYIIFIIGKYNDFKKNNLWLQNIPTVLFLGGIIIADVFWNFSNGCSSTRGIFVPFVVAGIFGILWAWIIDGSGAVNLQYFNGLSNRTYCTRPSTQNFKCSTNR
jgi:hypothetical protein